jgi:branched-chain amino acid transport system ATP-binding protein
MAMVLLAKPRLMLLDEPSLGLSPKAMAQVFEVIRELTSAGLSVLMVEQNAQQALAQCDRAVVLELGQVGLTGAAREILDHPQIRQHLLGL